MNMRTTHTILPQIFVANDGTAPPVRLGRCRRKPARRLAQQKPAGNACDPATTCPPSVNCLLPAPAIPLAGNLTPLPNDRYPALARAIRKLQDSCNPSDQPKIASNPLFVVRNSSRSRQHYGRRHCQLSGPRAPFSGPAWLERGSTIGEQRSSPTRAAAPPTRGAYHGRLS
jgi:hypothetical protein